MNLNINIGILTDTKINFELHNGYLFKNQHIEGCYNVFLDSGKIRWIDNLYDELIFEPESVSSSFTLMDVVIGNNFHWERKENQQFQGTLKFIVENNQITAINIIDTEDYLISVISSEMSSTASLELLKAHAVISRSWLLAQIEKKKTTSEKKVDFIENEEERIYWYDRDDHKNFDLCADDHCQRYQGISRAFKNFERVKEAVDSTKGEVLVWENKICDARYSKCCGGVSEEFQNCWEKVEYPYLAKFRDSKNDKIIPDLTQEQNVRKWIIERPEAFCNTTDKVILSQVLNNYDQETNNFYRWSVSYSRIELSDLISERSNIDFGLIQDLIPIERGTSGRIIKLKIVGSKRTMIIGKELEIRKILSKSHLYSSAFYVEKKEDIFTLNGAGWGHGVGLCQIGAAVMSEKGYLYDEILRHYYNNAEIRK